MNTPNTGIPYVPEGTLDPAAGLNLALNVIDALLQTAVINMDQTAPPGAPVDGDLHIVASPATGAWAGQENNLARYVAEGDFWQFFVAGVQVHLIVNRDDLGLYRFDSASSPGAWSLAAGLGDAPVDGSDYVRRDGAWELLESQLVVMNEDSPPTVVTDVGMVSFPGASVTEPVPGVARVEYPAAAPAAATILTVADETADIPGSRRLLAGSGIAFNDATPGQRTVSSTGGPPLPNKEWRNVDAAILTPLGASAITALGTQSTPAKATGGLIGYVGKRRTTSTTAANNVASFRSSNAQDEAYAGVTGSAAAAGLYLRMVFSTSIVVAGERFFAGMALNAADAGTTDPSAFLNCFGVAKDGADTNYQIIHNDGSGTATKIDTGLAFTAGKLFTLELSVPAGGGQWDYVLTDMGTGVQYSGSVAANIPANDAALNWRLWSSVGTTSGTAVAVDLTYVGLRYPL